MNKKKVSNVLNPHFTGEDMLEFNVADASLEYTLVFGANKNIARSQPFLFSGLKPVQQRVIYDLWSSAGQGKKLKKVASVAGTVMGRFHPHGDMSISESLISMGRPWDWNMPLIDKHGNFGNVQKKGHGAARYLECKLTAFTHDCYFSNFKESNVPMIMAYTDDEKEPLYLPAKYPMLLVNHQLSGIGYGMASNIPPFNFNEVLDATIKLVKDPKAKIHLIPDSPTGCDVVDNGQFKLINETGTGVFKLRASYEINYIENIIRFTSLPINSVSSGVVSAIWEMKKQGKFDEIVTFTDSSKNGVVDFSLILKKSANPEEVLKELFKKKIGLQDSYSAEIRAIDDLQSKVFSTKEALLTWIELRSDCLRAIYNAKIINALEEKHLNEVKIFITDEKRAKETMEIVFKTRNKEIAAEKLKERYKITSMQAAHIVGMRVHDFTADSREAFEARQKEIGIEVKEYERILESEHGIDEVIISELKGGKKLWNSPRKCKVIKEGKPDKNLIPDSYHIIGVSSDGYIKKINAEHVSVGQVGKQSSMVVCLINNRDNLLLFDSSGNISRLSVSALPNMEPSEIGVEISRYFKVNGSVVSMIKESDVKEHPDSTIVLVTEKGFGKKTSLSEFNKMKDVSIAITLDDNDKLVSAIPSMDTDDFIVYTNFGDGIRLSTMDFKLYKKTAKGLNLMSLRAEEKVVGIDILDGSKKYLVYITSAGRMKLTELKYFPVMKRKDEPLSLIALENNETLLGVHGVTRSEKDIITCFRKKSSPVQVKLKDLPVTSRVAKAEKVVKTPKGDEVVAYKITRL